MGRSVRRKRLLRCVTRASLRASPNVGVTSTVGERHAKRTTFPSAALRRALNLLSTDGSSRMHETSQLDVLDLLSANQRLLERLEAKNARLRDSVAELMLEIQALREALVHARSETNPK
jgi:hypothetical protein